MEAASDLIIEEQAKTIAKLRLISVSGITDIKHLHVLHGRANIPKISLAVGVLLLSLNCIFRHRHECPWF